MKKTQAHRGSQYLINALALLHFLRLPCGAIRGVNLSIYPAALHELYLLASTVWMETCNTH